MNKYIPGNCTSASNPYRVIFIAAFTKTHWGIMSAIEFNAKPQRPEGAKKENEISKIVIGAGIEVHRALGGPGLLESIYEAALCHELALLGLCVRRQVPIEVVYKGVIIRDPLYIDIIVEEKLIVEVKAVERNHPIYESQLLTYLRLTNLKLGLVLNFGNSQLKDGVARVVNGL
jgi:GxxExxY protein